MAKDKTQKPEKPTQAPEIPATGAPTEEQAIRRGLGGEQIAGKPQKPPTTTG